jgi:hypothetical protein
MAPEPFPHDIGTDRSAFQEQGELFSGMAMGRRDAVGTIQGQCTSPELLNPSTQGGWMDSALTRYIVERAS